MGPKRYLRRIPSHKPDGMSGTLDQEFGLADVRDVSQQLCVGVLKT